MPEGPEIKSMVDNIDGYIGTTLKKIDFVSGRYVHHGPPKNFSDLKLPQKIKDIYAHGKFIIIELEKDQYLYLTMGMSGYLDTEVYKHLRIKFKTSDGMFYMDDTRNFGQLQIFDTEGHIKKFKTLGYDPLGKNKKTKAEFRDYIRSFKKDWLITDAVMMPKFIAGIGNYLRAEIFYDSGIDPFCKLEDFTDQMLDALYDSTHRIIKHSYNKIKADSYINFKVYGREKCPKGNQILHIDRKGRRLWYCPNAIKFHCKK